MKKEYYIQGNPARAEEIKAAFEAKGIDTTCHSVTHDDYLYYSSDGFLYFEEFSNTLLNIFKTHPDYQELELPTKHKFNPKFKHGTWLWHKEKGDFPVLIAGYDEKKGYLAKYNIGLETYFGRDIIENYYRLWEISDARNGDVLVDKYGNVGIYEKMSELWWYSHIYFGCDGHLHGFEADGCHIQKNAKPATSGQRDMLFAKMKEAGYTWDSNKKELKMVPKHYDIANFHTGMPVLVRDRDCGEWQYVSFSHYRKVGTPFCAGGLYWFQCIPFNKDTKHLLGTIDMCPEEYLNW